MPVTILNIEQGSSEWKLFREGLYSGSNAHKLLRYGAINYARTKDTNFSGTFWTKRGGILEHEAIDLYEQINKTHVDRPGIATNSDYPNCCYSPDGICGPILIEVKCFDQKKHLELFGGEVPMEILAQIHFGLLICELKAANLIIYNPTLEPSRAYKVIEIRANRNISNNFKRILTKNKELVR